MSQRLPRIVLVWVLLLLTAWVIEPYVMVIWVAARQPRVVTPRGDLDAFERTTIDVFRQASPSVVHVYAAGGRALAGRGAAVLQTGSGVVWDGAGDIVTNHHVINGQNQFGVRLTSGEMVRARVIGVAPNYDLAVLRLERTRAPLRPITVGTSKDLQVGQAVFAIGNPYGLDQTLTNGIISALHRRLPESPSVEIADVIQTDAPINPGNSGGPLIDSAGRMIGLNTAILSESGASAGIGFAIPVDTVNRVASQLISTGSAPVPGIGIVSAGPAAAAQLGVDGIIILRVVPGSPAAGAGLAGVDAQTGTVGDIITAVNGKPVQTTADMSALLADVGIGHDATLTVERDGHQRKVAVQVADIGPSARPAG
ncbi:MAG TPA: trypsin-like peptidase domain-containing protein [Acetobacteraceae bacterium]|nr:trypsin-like peptidase domain-containing protein [Acetobacteraceae bacterium]